MLKASDLAERCWTVLARTPTVIQRADDAMPVILSNADAHLVLRLLKSFPIPCEASHLAILLEQGLSEPAPLLPVVYQAVSPADAYPSPASLPSGQPSTDELPAFFDFSRSDSPYAQRDHESSSKSPVITDAGNPVEAAPPSGSSWDVCGSLGRRRQRSPSGSPRRRQRLRRDSPNSSALVSEPALVSHVMALTNSL